MKYICSLYSLDAKTNSFKDTVTRQHRYEYAMKRTAMMLKNKENVYSPIVHCHEMSVKYQLPKDYSFWKSQDRHMIDKCDEVVVLKMNGVSGGWRESVGITDEINYAIKLGKPITYLECEDYCDPYNLGDETL